jgi:hypothetical protein
MGVMSFMSWLLNPWGKNLHYPLGRRLGGPKSWSECNGKKKKIPACGRNRTPVIIINTPTNFVWNIFYALRITNFKVIFDKFNIVEMCTAVNYARKCITNSVVINL